MSLCPRHTVLGHKVLGHEVLGYEVPAIMLCWPTCP